MTSPVLFEEKATASGQLLAIATLNSEKTLNSLTLEMVNLLLEQLRQWQVNDRVAVVLIQGSGQKAFCAGGDVQALYRSAIEQPGGTCEYAETFFENEYRLDYLLHSYDKPVIGWGHGIVMGGGLGIFAGCSHRVVTEKTRVAMPEVTIALFPDVGGSYFLNKMPGRVGLFLALTAASLNAADCLYSRIADCFVSASQQNSLPELLCGLNWSVDGQENHRLIDQLLAGLQKESMALLPSGNVEAHLDLINELCSGDEVLTIARAISEIASDDPWLTRARDGLVSGSPLAVHWIHRQLQQSRELPLNQVFQQELLLATNLVRYPEFAEGVRALLVDKDRKPKWQYASLEQVPAERVDDFFQPPWPENPLADL